MTDDVEIGLLIYNAGANNTRGLFVELPEEVTQSVIAINVLVVLGLTPFGGHRVRRLVPSEWIDSRIRPG